MSQFVKNKVTLVHCGEKGGYIHIPLGILYLAESLIKEGFEANLVDLRVRDLVADDLKDVLFLGVSHMTGSMQIPYALKCAKMAKSMQIPVVFGGTHPSILPHQTAAHPLVDIATKGDGEELVVELAEYFQGKKEIHSIKGIAYKDSTGKIVFTGERTPPCFDRTSHLPYNLLDMSKYLATNADFAYQSSRGCPHRCAFCAEVSLFDKKWRSKPAHIIVEEIENIIAKFNPKRIFFVDSNFFCNKNRVKEFCSLIIVKGIKTFFFAECRFDYFYKYSPELISLIKKAGFNEIEFGGESGSDITLSYIKKDITSEHIIKSIEKCKNAGIRSFTSFMIGFPGEKDEDMMKTLNIYDQILKIDTTGARINGMFIYSPFPGTELYQIAIDKWGFSPPGSIDEWAEFELYDASNITWLDKDKKKMLQTISSLVRYFFTYKTITDWSFLDKVKRHGSFLKTLLSLMFHCSLYPFARLRWKYRLFKFDYEVRLWQKIFYLYMGRK